MSGRVTAQEHFVTGRYISNTFMIRWLSLCWRFNTSLLVITTLGLGPVCRVQRL
ncbi:hypothetical protein Z949_2668 [Sulfitobacter guttiformis KCTC 32187]|nr:hypothetical protein Z949_2668 [Sulfitobacter guttiformis KCTC 32187]